MQEIEPMSEAELGYVEPARGDDERSFGCLSTERGHLPLEAMDVDARVIGLVSRIDLRQTFVNTTGEAIEATYIFPLPERAAVSRFEMEVAGRLVKGVIKERGQARTEYEDAIASGHRAALTEEERPGVFTMRVGNLMPGERATVRLTMTGPLAVAGGEATFRFPLVVAPRYIPGTPLPGDGVGDGVAVDTDAVPDASRISPPVLLPGFPSPVRLSLRVLVDPAGMPLSRLRSSLHAVDETREGGVHHVSLRPGERCNRDFLLRFSLADEAIRTALTVAPDDDGQGGTFALTLMPPREEVAPRPRDVVFVLDRSGSMEGWKMVAARRAVARMVDTLTDVDRFGVLAFDNVVEVPRGFRADALEVASDRNRFRAVELLAGLPARGGTEMAAPLAQAAAALAGGYRDRERILVLVTDGQVGNEDQLLKLLAPRLGGVRIFTLGIDRAVNAAFLERLATLGGGACELVESEDRLDEVMEALHRRIATPVITELSLRGDDGMALIAGTQVPARTPDLFTGVPLTVSGRYRGPAGSVRVTGQRADGTGYDERITAAPARDAAAADALVKTWARGQVRALEDQYAIGGLHGEAREALEKRIVETSLRHAVLSRFTAFLAVDEHEKVASGDPRALVQPVEAPEGWAMLGAPAPMAFAAPATAGPAGLRMGPPGGGPPAPSRPLVGRVRSFMERKRAPRPPAEEAEKIASLDIASADELDAGLPIAPPTATPTGPVDRAGLPAAWRGHDDLHARAAELRRELTGGRADLARIAAAVDLLADELASRGGDAPLVRALRELAALLKDAASRADAAAAASGGETLQRLLDEGPPARRARRPFWK